MVSLKLLVTLQVLASVINYDHQNEEETKILRCSFNDRFLSDSECFDLKECLTNRDATKVMDSCILNTSEIQS